MAVNTPTANERWNDAVANAKAALQEMITIQDECQATYDKLSEADQMTVRGARLEAVGSLDLQTVLETIEDAEQMDVS